MKFMNNEVVICDRKHFADEFDSYAYHFDWNWLIQAVEKIENTDAPNYVDEGRPKINLTHWIDLVYQQVVEFIKWYNERGHNKPG